MLMMFLFTSSPLHGKSEKDRKYSILLLHLGEEFKGAFNFSCGSTLTESLIKIYRRDKVLKF